jgi:adenosylhomocysteine nucleosidase
MVKRIGIMGALPEEINGIISLMENLRETVIGRRIFFSGIINHVEVVLVYSRMGKVAAATTVSALIHHFKITELIFTGVAGGLHHDVQIGDIVLAKRLVQHDMDARPLAPRYEIPLLEKTWFETSLPALETAEKAITLLFHPDEIHSLINESSLASFNIQNPKCLVGDVISGDQFISSAKEKQRLISEHPGALCVEMEGAAVAQVCYEHDIPYTIIRTISDVADDNSHIDFNSFIKEVASKYSVEIVKRMVR